MRKGKKKGQALGGSDEAEELSADWIAMRGTKTWGGEVTLF